MPLKTTLTEMLNIRVPIVQGGMQWVGMAPLVAAISNAGALGVLTALSQGSPEGLRQAIREVRKLTDKPFGVNITILPTINPPPYDEYAKVIVEEKVPVVETAGNAPGKMVQYFKSNGVITIHKCTTIRHALSAQKIGVDVVSIDGFECAGHPGEEDIGGLILLAQAARQLKIPYIASGGVADSRGIAMALAGGAVGVNMGTRFQCTVESPIHDNVKKAIVAAKHTDTVHIFRTLKNTARVYRNKLAEEVVKMERRPGGVKFEEIKDMVSGARGRRVYEDGDIEAGIWTMGTSAGLIDDVPTCKELIDRLEREVEVILSDMTRILAPPTMAKL
ncbi:hypothetical protein PROFUN_02970 [Planoprotostelium fungivorum]|uniref:Uncharacterized protein n=1 Tax=Planoprotostelium fungivorum TaxID=1890364 RepID=A0A2P6NX90_9EUKA|nr:hypothetical protein PROFUN_02970 [Planoprotostelium fungivorum]